MYDFYDYDVLLCTQKLLILLLKLYEKEKLSIDILHEHANLKIRYLEECTTKPEYSEYTDDSLNILSCYRNILADSLAPYRTQV